MEKSVLNTISEQCVCLIKMIFSDDIGNECSFSGTAFWIIHNNKILLVTNRHNLDATMQSNDWYKSKKLLKLNILVRQKLGDDGLQKSQWIDVNLTNIDGWIHQEADVAVLNIPAGVGRAGLKSEDIADEDYFQRDVKFLDPIFFIGYPQDWYDTTRNLPIARIAHIASDPNRAFANKDLKISKNTTLVTGLSFGGSSGSIVILPDEGIKGITTSNSKYRAPKCLGIMSGHLLDEKGHSGLSYFTRSSAIHDILRGEKVQSIKNCLHANATNP